MARAEKGQPDPIARLDETPIIVLVIDDLIDRAKVGKETYGTLLTINNGRDQLLDAYHEALDLACYLRAEIEERSQKVCGLGEPEDLIRAWNDWDEEGLAGEQD